VPAKNSNSFLVVNNKMAGQIKNAKINLISDQRVKYSNSKS